MMGEAHGHAGARLVDPVCGMTVDLEGARANGLTFEYAGVLYAFCRSGCLRAFREGPADYAASAAVASTAVGAVSSVGGVPTADAPVIDEGMRRWYESCSCCLGDTYPEIKAVLDAERAAAAQPAVGPGLCETLDAPAG